MAGAEKKKATDSGRRGETEIQTKRKEMSRTETAREKEREEELSRGRMLRFRVRYFTDGAVIGSRSFVNEAFSSARDRFGKKRKDGARRMKGAASAAAGTIWSLRDLRKAI
jgi:hypothetical protein